MWNIIKIDMRTYKTENRLKDYETKYMYTKGKMGEGYIRELILIYTRYSV